MVMFFLKFPIFQSFNTLKNVSTQYINKKTQFTKLIVLPTHIYLTKYRFHCYIRTFNNSELYLSASKLYLSFLSGRKCKRSKSQTLYDDCTKSNAFDDDSEIFILHFYRLRRDAIREYSRPNDRSFFSYFPVMETDMHSGGTDSKREYGFFRTVRHFYLNVRY